MKVEVTDNTKEVIEAKDAAVIKVLTMWGIQAEGYAKELCTVDTGLLRNSITWAISGKETAISKYKADKGGATGEYSGNIGKEGENAVYIGTNVEYAPYVELGTSRMKERPFIKPAVADHLDEYRAIAEEELKSN